MVLHFVFGTFQIKGCRCNTNNCSYPADFWWLLGFNQTKGKAFIQFKDSCRWQILVRMPQSFVHHDRLLYWHFQCNKTSAFVFVPTGWRVCPLCSCFPCNCCTFLSCILFFCLSSKIFKLSTKLLTRQLAIIYLLSAKHQRSKINSPHIFHNDKGR